MSPRPNNSLTYWLQMSAALPSVQGLKIPVSKQGKHRLFPALLSSTVSLIVVDYGCTDVLEKMSTFSLLQVIYTWPINLRPRTRTLNSVSAFLPEGTQGDNFRFRVALAGGLAIECPERSDCCQVN